MMTIGTRSLKGPKGAWDGNIVEASDAFKNFGTYYLYYHTLRYVKPWRPRFAKGFPFVEDLGVQVLITQRPFSLDIPVGQLASLGAGKTAPESVKNARAIALSQATRAAITAECTFGKKGGRTYSSARLIESGRPEVRHGRPAHV